jgi:hypothetical protein
MSVDFDTWYEYFSDDNVKPHDIRWNYPTEEQLPKEKLVEFCSIFDGFFLSPHDFIEGVPEKRKFITRGRAYKTLDEAREEILSRRWWFDKIMLYRFWIVEDDDKPFRFSIAEYKIFVPGMYVVMERILEKQSNLKCWCQECCKKETGGYNATRVVVCPDCGNKRCPRATNHELECSGSNDVGQKGSMYK